MQEILDKIQKLTGASNDDMNKLKDEIICPYTLDTKESLLNEVLSLCRTCRTISEIINKLHTRI